LELTELQQLHRMKTGALLTASCRLGAIAADASDEQLEAVTRFGQHLGLAFQIVDDLLDVTASPEELGKATGKDAEKGKNTYPVLLGIDASHKQAKAELESALTSISTLGDKAQGLRALARFVVQRKS
jgi:geranylgeranyl pyrophosphate synthase